jgi:hypothetical protein
MSTSHDSQLTARSGWYAAPIAEMRAMRDDEILGQLMRASTFADAPSQKAAWQRQLTVLRNALEGIDGWLYLEFEIPRLGSRIDAVVVSDNVVLVLEFKVGETLFRAGDRNQVWDYALELKNFHEDSHHVDIFPVLIATDVVADARGQVPWGIRDADGVWRPSHATVEELPAVIQASRAVAKSQRSVDGGAWGRARYRPTPTIIEAARALYARHSVDAIARHDAGAMNLRVTSRRVEEIADWARSAKRKAIVFVTGVPGAGKTLVGLNVATRHRDAGDATHAT